MLNRPQEYAKMAEVEREMWWYKSLHRLVLDGIEKHFQNSKDIKILDAGCGTGGLMVYLKNRGYSDLSGFDLSQHAVDFCSKNGLAVKLLDINQVDQQYAPNSYDVITCNDVLYFLTEEQRKTLFSKFKSLLEPNGIVISNVPALEAFKGMHDISVGIGKRFTKPLFLGAVNPKEFAVQKTLFWPFLLSPMVFLVRMIQRLSLLLNKNKKIESDVEMPSSLVNNVLFQVTLFERRFVCWKPFGSSLFVTLKKI